MTRPEEWTPGERLCLAGTQTDLPDAEQRRVVRAWCALLPTLEGLRFLWLNSRAPQALFDAACAVQGLEGLWVKWSGVTSVEAVEGATELRYLHLGSSPRLASIDPLAAMHGLSWLGLENIGKIDDLDPIGGLDALEGLYVEGSLWTTQRVRSLEPIGRLTGLRYLSIANLRSEDGTLEPLYALSRLEAFHAAQWWPDEQVREIERRNPGLTASAT